MSKIGRIPIKIPEDVQILIDEHEVSITGPKGTLVNPVKKDIDIKKQQGNIIVERHGDNRFLRALHGTTRAILANMVKGVTIGFTKTLVLHGTGFRARVEGEVLYLSLGFSHPVLVQASPSIKFTVNEDKVTIFGIDKQLVGEIADKIRKLKPPEPYKGKGIRYLDEIIRKKAGKKAVATA